MPRSAVRADAERRRQLAWDARVAGGTWKEAAAVAGFRDVGSAMRAVRKWRREMPAPELEEARAIARQRGEWLWRQAMQHVREGKPGAVTAAVRVLQRQATLLGTDAPSKSEIVSTVVPFWAGLYGTDDGPSFEAIEASVSDEDEGVDDGDTERSDDGDEDAVSA